MGALAEGLACMAASGDALEATDEALALAARGGQDWCVAELLRLRAQLLRHADAAAAEAALAEAVQLACRQGAHLWQWRAALDLARLLAETERAPQAMALLAAMVASSSATMPPTEADIARRLLAELRVARPGVALPEAAAAVQFGNAACEAERGAWPGCGYSAV